MVDRRGAFAFFKGFVEKPFIKAFTGARRSGKSTLMLLWRDELLRRGYLEENIVYIDKEDYAFDAITDYRELHTYIAAKLKLDRKKIPRAKRAVFIDEVQQISKWEKALASINTKEDADIYITGSNSSMLSSELATLLTGRHIEFHILPLGFGEFLDFRKVNRKEKNLDKHFEDFIKWGGLPGLHAIWDNEQSKREYLSSVYASVMLKDVLRRYQVRDPAQLEAVGRYAMANTGNIVSAKRISDYFKSQRITLTTQTTLNYLKHLCDAFLIYKTQRYDIQGKRHFEIHEKYYSVDHGLRNSLVGNKPEDISGIYENIVYLELRRRGYQVSIGHDQGREIDFVGDRHHEKIYVQVAYRLDNLKTVEREYGNLAKIRDNFPKFVVSGERDFPNRDGIRHKNIIDFLLDR